jgi:hypothetical protein
VAASLSCPKPTRSHRHIAETRCWEFDLAEEGVKKEWQLARLWIVSNPHAINVTRPLTHTHAS